MSATEIIEEEQIKNEVFPMHIKGFAFVLGQFVKPTILDLFLIRVLAPLQPSALPLLSPWSVWEGKVAAPFLPPCVQQAALG